MIYNRGDKKDYKKWAELVNDKEWEYDNLLLYFKKSENFTQTNPYSPIDDWYHGYIGSLYVTQSSPPEPIAQTIFNASHELGYNITDINGRSQVGSSILQIYTKNGRRSDSETAYIETAKDRQNLVILDRSYVTKIEINNETKRVEGVTFTRDNKTYFARSTKEVVLSAGAISTPQILMLSGVGPQDHLESFGIPVVLNLPVGKNLRDHAFTVVVFSSNSSNIQPNEESLQDSVRDFLKGVGKLTRPLAFDVINFFETPVEEVENYSNVELLFINISNSIMGQKFFGWTDETYGALDAKVPNPFAIELALLDSKSVGTVKLKSADPFDYPIIDSNILSDERDVEALYQGVQQAVELFKTEAFRDLNVTLAFDRFPGCEGTEPLSKEYWYCYLRRVTSLGYHQLGTCATATGPDRGVVDSELRVFGIKGLRIADASIIPFPQSGHINGVVVMVGEKAAHLVRDTHDPPQD